MPRKLTITDPVVGRQSCVLLVDDEDSILYSTRLLLEVNGYIVLTATNADEAAALFRAFAVDAAIMDFGAAWSDGDFLPAVIKAARPTVKNVVWSTDSEAAEYREGVDILLAKPTDSA